MGRVDGSKVIVEDAYPLFHSRVISPILESAFELVDKRNYICFCYDISKLLILLCDMINLDRRCSLEEKSSNRRSI